MHFARVHVIALVVDEVCLMLVVVHAVVIAFPWPILCIKRYTLYNSDVSGEAGFRASEVRSTIYESNNGPD